MIEIPENEIVINNVQTIKFALWKRGGGIHQDLLSWPAYVMKDLREPEFLHVFRKELPVNGVILDIGANIGYNTLTAAQMISEIGGKGIILAIEPDPRNYQFLQRAIQENIFDIPIHTFNLALSNFNGNSEFYLSDATNLNSFKKTKHSKEFIVVEVKTLFDFMSGRGFPDFIKMDVEGAEVEILEGGLPLFKQSFPCKILMEVHPKLYHPGDLQYQLYALLDLGFHIKYVMSAGVACPDEFKAKGYKPDMEFQSGSFTRGLYTNIKEDDAIEWASNVIHQKTPVGVSPKIVRAIMLERE